MHFPAHKHAARPRSRSHMFPFETFTRILCALFCTQNAARRRANSHSFASHFCMHRQRRPSVAFSLIRCHATGSCSADAMRLPDALSLFLCTFMGQPLFCIRPRMEPAEPCPWKALDHLQALFPRPKDTNAPTSRHAIAFITAHPLSSLALTSVALAPTKSQHQSGCRNLCKPAPRESRQSNPVMNTRNQTRPRPCHAPPHSRERAVYTNPA